ncbi:hypothetical protein A9G11_02365 [Gilliamella sp. wkB108]|nr:hypothetical protein A9G11_02365 [Gilliamella apicola]
MLNLNDFLGLTLSDNSKITPSTTSSVTNPIILPNESDTFASVVTLIPTNSYPSISFDSLVKNYNYWLDEDGDKNPSATGDLKLTWKTVSGQDITSSINLADRLNPCDSPYTLTIEATNTTLQTQYGVPRDRSLTSSSHTYYIKPTFPPYVCYAQPNLNPSADKFKGPAHQWDPSQGFKIQTRNIAEKNKNFPTIASDNLFFKMKIYNATANDIININGSKVYSQYGKGVTLDLTAENNDILRVTLRGPNSKSNGNEREYSNSAFAIYADQAKQRVLYTFEITRWLVAKPGQTHPYNLAIDYCNNYYTNYGLAGVRDLTNATAHNSEVDWDIGDSPNNHFTRWISYSSSTGYVGGIMNEWGDLGENYYPNSEWELGDYYTTDISKVGDPLNIWSGSGDIDIAFFGPYSQRAACINWQ